MVGAQTHTHTPPSKRFCWTKSLDLSLPCLLWNMYCGAAANVESKVLLDVWGSDLHFALYSLYGLGHVHISIYSRTLFSTAAIQMPLGCFQAGPEGNMFHCLSPAFDIQRASWKGCITYGCTSLCFCTRREREILLWRCWCHFSSILFSISKIIKHIFLESLLPA